MEEAYNNELWDEIKQTSVNLSYLDDLRAAKARIEPHYKGITAAAAIITAIVACLGESIPAKILAVLTALLTAIPLLFPVIPNAADFAEMDHLRTSVKEYLNALESLWFADAGIDRQKYRALKKNYVETETEISALFGKISPKRNKYAVEISERYLERFFTS